MIVLTNLRMRTSVLALAMQEISAIQACHGIKFGFRWLYIVAHVLGLPGQCHGWGAYDGRVSTNNTVGAPWS